MTTVPQGPRYTLGGRVLLGATYALLWVLLGGVVATVAVVVVGLGYAAYRVLDWAVKAGAGW